MAAFVWLRATQTTETAAPIQTAEPSARLASEPPPNDSLIAEATLAASDSFATDAAAGDDSLASPTAASSVVADSQAARAVAPDSAALAGEFPVRELAGASRAAAPATPAAAASPTQQTTRPAPTRRSPIDPPPDLTELAEADRDALVGTAPDRRRARRLLVGRPLDARP